MSKRALVSALACLIFAFNSFADNITMSQDQSNVNNVTVKDNVVAKGTGTATAGAGSKANATATAPAPAAPKPPETKPPEHKPPPAPPKKPSEPSKGTGSTGSSGGSHPSQPPSHPSQPAPAPVAAPAHAAAAATAGAGASATGTGTAKATTTVGVQTTSTQAQNLSLQNVGSPTINTGATDVKNNTNLKDIGNTKIGDITTGPSTSSAVSGPSTSSAVSGPSTSSATGGAVNGSGNADVKITGDTYNTTYKSAVNSAPSVFGAQCVSALGASGFKISFSVSNTDVNCELLQLTLAEMGFVRFDWEYISHTVDENAGLRADIDQLNDGLDDYAQKNKLQIEELQAQIKELQRLLIGGKDVHKVDLSDEELKADIREATAKLQALRAVVNDSTVLSLTSRISNDFKEIAANQKELDATRQLVRDHKARFETSAKKYYDVVVTQEKTGIGVKIFNQIAEPILFFVLLLK